MVTMFIRWYLNKKKTFLMLIINSTTNNVFWFGRNFKILLRNHISKPTIMNLIVTKLQYWSLDGDLWKFNFLCGSEIWDCHYLWHNKTICPAVDYVLNNKKILSLIFHRKFGFKLWGFKGGDNFIKNCNDNWCKVKTKSRLTVLWTGLPV